MTIRTATAIAFVSMLVGCSGDSGPGGADPCLFPPDVELPAVDRLVCEMGRASIAYNVPPEMNIEDTAEIQLLLSPPETVDDLKEAITAEGQRMGAEIEYSDSMQASLIGPDFEISPFQSAIQPVPTNQRTEWRWEIRPREPGTFTLRLSLEALLNVNGESTPRLIETFARDIVVTVTLTQRLSTFFSQNWQWLWAAILVPVVGLIWRQRTKRRPTGS